MQFAKRPETIEAVKVPNREYGDNPYQGWEEMPDWLEYELVRTGTIKPIFLGQDYWYYQVPVQFEEPDSVDYRNVNAAPDDYIVRGVNGLEVWTKRKLELHYFPLSEGV